MNKLPTDIISIIDTFRNDYQDVVITLDRTEVLTVSVHLDRLNSYIVNFRNKKITITGMKLLEKYIKRVIQPFLDDGLDVDASIGHIDAYYFAGDDETDFHKDIDFVLELLGSVYKN